MRTAGTEYDFASIRPLSQQKMLSRDGIDVNTTAPARLLNMHTAILQAAEKKFINTELSGPGGPTSVYAGAPTSVARRRPRAPLRAVAPALSSTCPRPAALSPEPAHSLPPSLSLPPSPPLPLLQSLPLSFSLRVSNVTKGSTK